MNGNAIVRYTGGMFAVVGLAGLTFMAVAHYFGENVAILAALVVFGVLLAVFGQETDDEDEPETETDDQGRDLPGPGGRE